VLSLLAENIEFAPCTELSRIDTFEPWIDTLQSRSFLATTSGISLAGSPLAINFQTAFPLVRQPYAQDGGGPSIDPRPAFQWERLAGCDSGREKLVLWNEPDIGGILHDRRRAEPSLPQGGTMFEDGVVMEIQPIEGALHLHPEFTLHGKVSPNRVFAWLQMLNQGHRISAVVNSGAISNFHGSGGLRNWIQSSTDDPARIMPMDVVRAVREGRTVMSNGPFLEVMASQPGKGPSNAPGGAELQITSAGKVGAKVGGKVQLAVKVQCPNWLNVDRLFVLVNGRVHPLHNYTRKAHPEKFRESAESSVRFEEVLTIELTADAHLSVVTGGADRQVRSATGQETGQETGQDVSPGKGAVMGPEWKETETAALSNPIYVDIDGNGFQPNKDKLGHPLPGKFTGQ